jgi:hypothetical protein
VQTHFARERGPGKLRDFQIVVQKLDEVTGPSPNLLGLGRLFDRIEMEPDVVDTATRRPDDRIELFEALDEKGLGSSGIVLATTVSHRLPAAGLIERVFDRAAEPFKQLNRRDADFRKKGVDIARNKESDLHRRVPPVIPNNPTERLTFTEHFIVFSFSCYRNKFVFGHFDLLSNFLKSGLETPPGCIALNRIEGYHSLLKPALCSDGMFRR